MIFVELLFLACTPQSPVEHNGNTNTLAEEEEEEDQSVPNNPEEDTGSPEQVELDVCDLAAKTDLTYALPSSFEEAAQLTLVAGPGESYLLSKQANAEGWFVLEVPSWMCQIELYSKDNVSITMEASDVWELNDVAFPALECDEETLFRHSWTFHAWGSYIVHIKAENMTEIWLASALVNDI